MPPTRGPTTRTETRTNYLTNPQPAPPKNASSHLTIVVSHSICQCILNDRPVCTTSPRYFYLVRDWSHDKLALPFHLHQQSTFRGTEALLSWMMIEPDPVSTTGHPLTTVCIGNKFMGLIVWLSVGPIHGYWTQFVGYLNLLLKQQLVRIWNRNI